MSVHWRDMRVEDLPAVGLLGDTYHPPHLWEPPEAAASRFEICRKGNHRYTSFMLTANGMLAGYCLAHAWDDTVPPLRSVVTEPPRPTRLFIHDLVVHPDYRGSGHATRIVYHMRALASEFGGAMGLVAVNGTADFWHGLGFHRLPADVSTYGPDAAYMVCP